ncbi:SDR family oxidoreductase [Vibrio ziniensis]|uniref:SDR family oxidoreductase n=1 Tax=Vibrio ziniensis TaxID=2711221 RepID=A0A6G7CJQ7_9VIBR|nr:SDR family oxidoreductase [Vibrio ziniensis]QIH42345.1 SDR family oxidoreductase [Vibrio ziniensis]
MEIKSAIVLITSASSQLGRTLATHFTCLGATVILCDSDKQGLYETYSRCKELSNHVDCYHLRDYSPESLNGMFDNIESSYHTVPDVLINNWPSSPMPSLIDEKPTELFIQNLALMASSLFSFGQACTERMRYHNVKGVIVNVISINDSHDFSGIENATCMVSGFTQSWAKELVPFNIRVGGVVPMISTSKQKDHWAEVQDDLIRNTEYIVANEYFSGRVMSA